LISNSIMSNLIVLLTDFGDVDGYVGVMKGVCLKKSHDIQFVDLSNQIPSQSVDSAAFVLWNSYKYFPENSVFLCVVDPGVGTGRKVIAAKISSGQQFVAPDNGLLKYVLGEEPNAEIFEICNPQKEVSSTFHGRDIMAPAAAELAAGKDITTIGKAVKAETRAEKISEPPYKILHIDKFGNLITNIPVSEKNPELEVNDIVIKKKVSTYAETGDTELVLIPGSSGFWEIAVKNGSAFEKLFSDNTQTSPPVLGGVPAGRGGKNPLLF